LWHGRNAVAKKQDLFGLHPAQAKLASRVLLSCCLRLRGRWLLCSGLFLKSGFLL